MAELTQNEKALIELAMVAYHPNTVLVAYRKQALATYGDTSQRWEAAADYVALRIARLTTGIRSTPVFGGGT